MSIFSSAALSNFKISRKRISAISARSGIADKDPPREDKNMWKTLLESHRGYTYSVRVVARILHLLRKRGSVSQSGPTGLSPHQKVMWTLFAAERANSYHAIENRRGTPSFKIEEVNNILFSCGRKMAEDLTSAQPSIHRQDAHHLLKDIQESKFRVPILSPHTALGRAVARTLHDECCGSSPATALEKGFKIFLLQWTISKPFF